MIYHIYLKDAFKVDIMSNWFTEDILNPSLELIRNDYKIKRFYFFPGLLSVVFLSVLLVYQVVYTYIVLLEKKDVALEFILAFFHSDYLTETLIAGAIFIIFYIILIPIFDGGLIRYIDKKKSGEASRSDSIWFWVFRFYPLFEFNNIFNMFKFISIINGFLFSLRFLGIEYLTLLSVIFSTAFFFSIIINILVAYARYEIVLENKTVFEAIGVSSQIALLNIKTTIRLYFMMFIMNIKVLINFFVFLIFPILSAFIFGFISSQTFATIALVILGWLFLFIILVLWYMAAVLDVFTTSIWYNAYKIWKSKLQESTKD